MLPMRIREAMWRMSQGPKVEHRKAERVRKFTHRKAHMEKLGAAGKRNLR